MNKLELITMAQQAEKELKTLIDDADRFHEFAQKSETLGANEARKILSQYAKQLDKKAAKCIALRKDAKLLIDGIPDEISRTILTRRFLNGENWEHIAEEMHFSLAHIYRLRKKALASL